MEEAFLHYNLDYSINNKKMSTLGIKENWIQFSLLVLVNALVGAMVGMERSILPNIAENVFNLASNGAILSFIVVFGLSKAITNYFAGRLCDRLGRKIVLVLGWLIATPVPFMLMWAPSWNWFLFANVFLGVSQGFTWSTTVIMKIDLAGPKNRGLAMGLNEFAGYAAVAASALLTGYIAVQTSVRPEPFYLGIVFVVLGLILSLFWVKETRDFVSVENIENSVVIEEKSHWEVCKTTSFYHPNLSSICQAGMINNANDGMAWGIFPILYAANGIALSDIAVLVSIYPAVWGIGQLFTGAWSDKIGRKKLIVAGMWIQSVGIALVLFTDTFSLYALSSAMMGAGTAMVYPTLLAGIGDSTSPSWRASSVGIYRLWRDSGYAVGAVLAGIIADVFGLIPAISTLAILTFVSGLVVAFRMIEQRS
jgi:MFS family permease